ncbi:MAG: (Na+)-NQR maturation NqrM [Oligoflexus sp.]
METIAAIAVFAFVIAGMAVGVIFAKKPITGSCGGLNNLNGGDGKCDICGATAADPERCKN